MSLCTEVFADFIQVNPAGPQGLSPQGLITVTVFSYKTYQNLLKITTSQRLDSEKKMF